MKDTDKILSALKHCLPYTKEEGDMTCDTCPYYRCDDGVRLSTELVMDIRKALEEQIAVRPIVSSVEIRCGACRKVIEMDGWVCCPWCGKRIDKYWKENSHG